MHKTIDGFLSIVMPVYNEEAVIEKVICDFSHILEQFSRYEFIVVDDGSTDRTSQLLHKAQERYPFLSIIRNSSNRGHAQSLLTVLTAARGDFIFCCDSDNQFYAEDFWLLWDAMQKKHADAALGYRLNRKDPFHRIIIAMLLRVFIFLVFFINIRDGASSFRLYTRQAITRIIPIISKNPFFIFPLMSIIGYKYPLRVCEVPVRHLPRTTGVTYLRGWNTVSTCFKTAKELLMFKMRFCMNSFSIRNRDNDEGR